MNNQPRGPQRLREALSARWEVLVCTISKLSFGPLIAPLTAGVVFGEAPGLKP